MYGFIGFIFFLIYVFLISKYFKEQFTLFVNGICGNYSQDTPTTGQKSLILLILLVVVGFLWIIIVPLTVLFALLSYAVKVFKL